MNSRIVLALGALLVLLGLAWAAPSPLVASFVDVPAASTSARPHRPRVVHQWRTDKMPAPPALVNPFQAGGTIEWNRTDAYGIYTSCGISRGTGSTIFGSSLVSTPDNPNKAEIAELMGDFKPTMSQAGPNMQVAASRDATIFVSASYNEEKSSILVSKYSADNSKPDWTYTLQEHIPASNGVVVSADGSTIAILTTKLDYVSENQTRLYIFKSDSSTPVNVWSGLGGAYTLRITDDGRYAAFHIMSYIYVLDTRTATLRWTSQDLGFNDAALGLSEDGNYLAYGFTTLFVLKWNAQQSEYVKVWDLTPGTHFVESIALNSETLAVGWASFSANQNRIQAFSPRSSEPAWTVDYDQVENGLQDIPANVAVTEDGQYILATSWGSKSKTNPEVRVYWKLSPNPIYTLSTPGSVFTASIVTGPSMFTLNAVVGCKQAHANEWGRGGVFYSIYIPTRCKATNDC